MYNRRKNQGAQRLLQIAASCKKAQVYVESETYRIIFDEALAHERPALFKALRRRTIHVVHTENGHYYLAEITLSQTFVTGQTLIDRFQDYAERSAT